MISSWIQTNLQMVMAAVTVLAGGLVYATFGSDRVEDENGERYRRANKQRRRRTVTVSAAVLIGVLTVPIVPAGHAGVIFDRFNGTLPDERGEGITFTIPLVQYNTNMSVREQLYTVESFVQTKDLQEVTLPVAVNFEITDGSFVYQKLGPNYVPNILAPAVSQAVTKAAGQIVAEDIAQSREKLTESILVALTADLADDGIVITDVAVKDAIFDKAFIESVKNKVIAEQKAAESETLVEVAENEATQEVKRSEGAATAAANAGRGQAEAIAAIQATLGGGTEAYVEWLRLNKWNGQVPQVVLGEEADPIIPMPELHDGIGE